MKKQRQLANLRPFPKGRSGNPGGRPQGLSITAAVRRELADAADLLIARKVMGEGDVERWEAEALTKADVVAARVVKMALDGDLDAIKLVWAYVDGKPTESLDVTGEVGHTVTIDAIRKAIGIVS